MTSIALPLAAIALGAIYAAGLPNWVALLVIIAAAAVVVGLDDRSSAQQNS
ncbi:hypothetical protein [Corynebacterium tapiri]|uniref:hypothetical protein n=1 Tax=Corynebacterium tapiri TaxID=1448266 RepID=UPI0015D630C4|nr:hypothetical protein [Corynebacterium tapiri]